MRPISYPGNITLSGGMTLTVDSDLRGPSLQFTFTCISTGGPATTITWIRDPDTVIERTGTVLDDRVTARYNHTLTVTGRLGDSVYVLWLMTSHLRLTVLSLVVMVLSVVAEHCPSLRDEIATEHSVSTVISAPVSETDSGLLITLIEEWASGGASIIVRL